ncbi:hypothetical protein KSS87_016824, partial [Heliosperma pusillum]
MKQRRIIFHQLLQFKTTGIEVRKTHCSHKEYKCKQVMNSKHCSLSSHASFTKKY